MLVNTGSSRLVIGRLSILPGEKVPPVALTSEEQKAVAEFARKGMLKEMGAASQPKPEPAPAPEAPKPEPVIEPAPVEEAPKEHGKGKKGKAD